MSDPHAEDGKKGRGPYKKLYIPFYDLLPSRFLAEEAVEIAEANGYGNSQNGIDATILMEKIDGICPYFWLKKGYMSIFFLSLYRD